MTASRLARRLGLDGNPLRRRSDKRAAGLAALLAAVFVIGAPWLSVAAADGPAARGPSGTGPSAPGAELAVFRSVHLGSVPSTMLPSTPLRSSTTT